MDSVFSRSGLKAPCAAGPRTIQGGTSPERLLAENHICSTDHDAPQLQAPTTPKHLRCDGPQPKSWLLPLVRASPPPTPLPETGRKSRFYLLCSLFGAVAPEPLDLPKLDAVFILAPLQRPPGTWTRSWGWRRAMFPSARPPPHCHVRTRPTSAPPASAQPTRAEGSSFASLLHSSPSA